MSRRFVCIHGHFYQPPREDPWSGKLRPEPSAAPFANWNERIDAECYAPNRAARLLGAEDKIRRIVNNYARMSFNIGATLLAWLETHDAPTYHAIIAADRESRGRFGSGAAIAQPYGHVILPLAHPRDRTTHVRWGVRDFELRFGRKPVGMWLPETAVDVDSLEALAAEGILFTVLAPHQAKRIRRPPGPFSPTTQELLPTGRAYIQHLPSGNQIVAFFYQGALARAVAFERLLDNGDRFAERLASSFEKSEAGQDQLLHIATDGESYGHHHRHGEMALAYALDRLERQGTARPIHYAAYLEAHPPEDEVEILEDTSWSCAHGIERWRSDCGCNTSGPRQHQRWRGPLRTALRSLRDDLAALTDERGGLWYADPWAARDGFIDVVLADRESAADAFLARYATRSLGSRDRQRALTLMTLWRHALLMETSCGWFFDDVAGLETVLILRQAARAIELAQELFDVDLEARFRHRLAECEGNDPLLADGRIVYDRLVRGPRRADQVAELAKLWRGRPHDIDYVRMLSASIRAAELGPTDPRLWELQNAFEELRLTPQGDKPNPDLVRELRALADLLGFAA